MILGQPVGSYVILQMSREERQREGSDTQRQQMQLYKQKVGRVHGWSGERDSK